jgi:CRP-like cAMP-binding protein
MSITLPSRKPGHRGSSDKMNARLATAPLFAACTEAERVHISRLAAVLTIDAGAHLVRENSRARTFGVIVAGNADVFIGDNKVATLLPGDHFGEIGLLDLSLEPGAYVATHTATITANCEMTVAIISWLDFLTMCSEHPSVRSALLQTARERYQGRGDTHCQ